MRGAGCVNLVVMQMALATSIQAFSPAARAIGTRQSLRSQPAQVCAPTRRTQLTMVSTFGAIAAAPALYGLMSMNEYVTHRWYQHEEFNRDHALQRLCRRIMHIFSGRSLNQQIKIKGGGHVEHHAETYDDMSLKKDPRLRRTPAAASLDKDPFRG